MLQTKNPKLTIPGDYCDVYLTHDSMSVRKAHNSGRNHERNVLDYYQSASRNQSPIHFQPVFRQSPFLRPFSPSILTNFLTAQKSATKKLNRSSTPSQTRTTPRASRAPTRCSRRKEAGAPQVASRFPHHRLASQVRYLYLMRIPTPPLPPYNTFPKKTNAHPPNPQASPHPPSCPAAHKPVVPAASSLVSHPHLLLSHPSIQELTTPFSPFRTRHAHAPLPALPPQRQRPTHSPRRHALPAPGRSSPGLPLAAGISSPAAAAAAGDRLPAAWRPVCASWRGWGGVWGRGEEVGFR